jgi:sulfate permease, SulP family
MNSVFKPKLFTSLQNYSKKQFLTDIKAGIIVSVVALPLAIAIGIASGVTPEKGLYTTIIAGFLISFFGGSKVQIGGPTGAMIILVYSIIQQFGVIGLTIATMIAGVMLIAMGILKLGAIIKYMPFPVIIGLNSGIALNIFSSQVKDFLGLHAGRIPVNFSDKWLTYFKHMDSINLWSVVIGITTVIIISLITKFMKKIPSFLITIVIITIGVYFLRVNFGVSGIETIADRFSINAALPDVNPPAIDFNAIKTLLPTAFTIAMLGAIISLLSATVSDGVTGDKHNPNTELIAQGIANIVSPIFGGIPASGAIARTMTNVNNGGRTPVAGIVHAVVLLLILVFLGGLTKHIPMACLAGVLVVVSYNMSDWRTFKALLKNPKSDVVVLLSTFFLTVVFDMTISIEVGIMLAIVLFVRRISETSSITVFTDAVTEAEYTDGSTDNEQLLLPKDVEVYEIEGPFFFCVAHKFEETMKQVGDRPKVQIIRMRKVPFIDSTGAHNLLNLIHAANKNKIQIILSGVNEKVHDVLNKNGIEELLGAANVCSHISLALARAEEIVNKNQPAK